MNQTRSLFAMATPAEEFSPGLRRRALASGEGFELTQWFFDADVRGGGHAHGYDEAAFIVDGEFRVRLGEESNVVGAGDSYTLPAGVPHDVQCEKAGSYVVLKLALAEGVDHHHDHDHDHDGAHDHDHDH